MDKYELATVDIKEIECADRARTELGDLDELINSFKKYGIIQTLAVAQITNENYRYRLLAGGRRYEAAIRAGIERVPVKIYLTELSDMQMKSIELEENLRRKELSVPEKCRLMKEIHELQISIHGRKISTSPDASGHSLRDTANMLNVDHAEVSRRIKIANAMEQFPELDWSSCKTDNDAMKILNKFEERVTRAELSSRAAELMKSSKTQKIIDSYILGDFFEMVKGLPSKTFDLVEIDPPYGIDLPSLKNEHGMNYGDSYNEVDSTGYIPFLINTIKEAYRVMKDDSWLIFWFGPEPWFEVVYQMIVQAGFECRRLTGIWTKGNGQVRNPDRHLARSHENFFYARKGNAVINLDKRGRADDFRFDPVPPSQKIHPTERPVALIEEILRVFVWEGSRILVPFAGSGNTLRAAFNLNMFPIGYDLSKEYKDSFTVRVLNEEKDKSQ